MVLNQ